MGWEEVKWRQKYDHNILQQPPRRMGIGWYGTKQLKPDNCVNELFTKQMVSKKTFFCGEYILKKEKWLNFDEKGGGNFLYEKKY